MEQNKLANPAPLGLMGFGMTTVLLNIHNAGFFALDGTILAMGVFFGGLAQLLAGTMEFKKGNTFGTTAFTSYGLFWLSLVAIIAPKGTLFHMGVAHDPKFLGWYLFMWGVFTAFMFWGTLKSNKALQFVFGSLTLLFGLLAVGHWIPGPTGKLIVHIAGFEGIVCGASAIYLAMAEVLEEQHGKPKLPIGKPAV